MLFYGNKTKTLLTEIRKGIKGKLCEQNPHNLDSYLGIFQKSPLFKVKQLFLDGKRLEITKQINVIMHKPSLSHGLEKKVRENLGAFCL